MVVIFIIGAPRSGTNMLRNIVTSFDHVKTWPCDEINYILRHGNVRHPSDEFGAEHARPEVKSYLFSTFEKFGKKIGARILVEKTCANSLRVQFLNAVFPRAKYIFMVRDGIDATGSAKLRWTAKLDLRYILKKVRFVPKTDLIYYSLRYLWARLHRFFSKEKRLAFWGPKLNEMQDILARHSLNEACAIQWQECVEKADKELDFLGQDKVCRVQYEGFVSNPKYELARVLKFLGVEATEKQLVRATAGVSANSVGKGRQSLGNDEVRNLENLVGMTLTKFGYMENE